MFKQSNILLLLVISDIIINNITIIYYYVLLLLFLVVLCLSIINYDKLFAIVLAILFWLLSWHIMTIYIKIYTYVKNMATIVKQVAKRMQDTPPGETLDSLDPTRKNW